MTKTDRRVVYVKLTDSGKTQLEKIAQKMDELMDQIVEELGKEDTAELARLLDKLYIILEKPKSAQSKHFTYERNNFMTKLAKYLKPLR